MEKFRILVALLAIGLGSVSPTASAGAGVGTGQGLIDTCKVVSIARENVTPDDTALLLLCVMQFQAWRDAWMLADSYNEHTLRRRGPICVPESVTNQSLIEGFVQWAGHSMTREQRTQPSTVSVYTFMYTKYRCA